MIQTSQSSVFICCAILYTPHAIVSFAPLNDFKLFLQAETGPDTSRLVRAAWSSISSLAVLPTSASGQILRHETQDRCACQTEYPSPLSLARLASSTPQDLHLEWRGSSIYCFHFQSFVGGVYVEACHEALLMKTTPTFFLYPCAAIVLLLLPWPGSSVLYWLIDWGHLSIFLIHFQLCLAHRLSTWQLQAMLCWWTHGKQWEREGVCNWSGITLCEDPLARGGLSRCLKHSSGLSRLFIHRSCVCCLACKRYSPTLYFPVRTYIHMCRNWCQQRISPSNIAS